MLRRLTAALMLLSLTLSSVESVTGVLRDGSVHHEGSATAAAHAVQTHGEHGHEDGAPHGPDHQHGTTADHCTHQHGTVVSEKQHEFIVLSETLPALFLDPVPWLDCFSEPSFRPPLA